MRSIDESLYLELDRVSQTLTWRINELVERYKFTLPELNDKVSDYEKKVNDHLIKMWFSI
jgi:type I restriction enzyme M protein